MRHNLFGKKLKPSLLFATLAIVLSSVVLGSTILTHSAHAVSKSEAEAACAQMKGKFTDNSTALTSNIGECKGEIGAGQRETIKRICLDTDGTMSGQSDFNCYWSKFDDVQKTPKASAIRKACESVEGTTYTNMGEFATCHDLPLTQCQALGGYNSLPSNSQVICRWDKIIDDSGSTTIEPDPDDGAEATCHTAAGGLGWILCPVLEGAANAANWAYENVIEPMLVVEPELFRTDRTDGNLNGTYQAWQIFRDIANIIFAILLLVVIFSQVTGFGIDNYGVKKTLPKLIVAAVLVNISFYICQGLVDISNIVGSGLNNMLAEIASGIKIPEGSVVSSDAASITFGIIAVITTGAIGTIVGGAAFWASLGSLLFAFVPILLSAVVAILMFFVLLAMRKAVVVILVALSPLAFIAYSLPNTKKLFDRWSEVLRGMLLLFPISALLMGGGRLASKIIFASGAGDGGGSWAMILPAMAAEIIPLFLIPSVTRSAYKATGALGATINRLSSRATAGTRKGVQNSGAYKRTQGRIDNFRAQQRMNGRRMRRYEAAAEAERNGNATGLQHFTALMGRHRAAAVKQAAYEAGKKQGDIDAWAAADVNTIGEGARQKARIEANQQITNTSDYADKSFQNAVVSQNDTEHENKVDRQLLWNNGRYVTGKRNANDLALENEFYDARLMADGGVVSGKRAQARITRNASRQNAEHYNDATYQEAAAAALQRKERDENIKSRESLLANGAFRYTDASGITHTVNGFNTGEVRRALEYTLGDQYAGDNREADIHALVNTLSAQGDAGRSAVYDALQTVDNSVNGINGEARQYLSQNIMQYHAADFKNNQRSVFDYARANTGETAATVSLSDGSSRTARFADYSAHATGSLNQEMLANMDESELQRYADALNADSATTLVRRSAYADDASFNAAEAAAQKQLRELARDTLSNANVVRNLKGNQRRILESIAQTQNNSQTIIVDHSTSGRPTDENGRTIPFPGPDNNSRQ